MDRCPVELVEKIASYACTDGGKAGCSLSLTCRYLRDAVRPVRYQTVALIGGESAIRFADFLSQLDVLPVIRHLFISLLGEPYLDCGAGLQAMYKITEERWTVLQDAMVRILTLASPTLAIVFSYDPVRVPDNEAIPMHFPVLTSLSASYPLATYNSFPALRRLHISNVANLRQCEIFREDPTTLAAARTHLRISGIGHDPFTPAYLRVLLDVAPREVVNAQPPTPLTWELSLPPQSDQAVLTTALSTALPQLEHVYMQPLLHRTSMDNYIGGGWDVHQSMVAELVRIHRVCAVRDGRKLDVLPETGKSSRGYGLAEAHEHWLDLARGGDGPWYEPGEQHKVLRNFGYPRKPITIILSISLSVH